MPNIDVKSFMFHGVELITIKDAARVIGVSAKTLRDKLKSGLLDGQIDALRCPIEPRRAYGVPKSQVLAFVAQGNGGRR